MPLFQFDDKNQANRIKVSDFNLEKHLQHIIEQNLEELFGVRIIASEFVVRGEQLGRIDTLGLDHEGAPTIIEYKLDKNENVINQGLYYMNWLLDHRGDFIVAARDAIGDVEVDWSHPRLIIVAKSYAKWDTYAVKRMGEGIELWEYVRYGNNLLYLNQMYGQQRSVPKQLVASNKTTLPAENENTVTETEYSIDYHLESKSEYVRQLFGLLRQNIMGLATEEGDIIETPNKLYISYRHGKNFCEVQFMAKGLKLFLDLDISEISDPKQIVRDMSNKGHWGTGNIEIRLNSLDEIEYVRDLIEQAYRLTL